MIRYEHSTMTILDELQQKQLKLISDASLHRQADSLEEAKIKIMELVVFKLSGDYYAFESVNVKEILPYSYTTPIPGCPETIKGVLNVRGDIESVLNLHRLLGLDECEPTSQSRIILAHSETIRSGIFVDSVEDVIRIDKELIKPPISTLTPTIKSFAAGGETFYHGNYVILLEIKKLFQAIRP